MDQCGSRSTRQIVVLAMVAVTFGYTERTPRKEGRSMPDTFIFNRYRTWRCWPGHAFCIALLAAAVAGCEAPPRDTSMTPPPPRLPIAAGDEVYPAPGTARDTRPATPTR